jgi:hypothetical protein
MVGILFEHEYTGLVILTIEPDKICDQCYERIPALILSKNMEH